MTNFRVLFRSYRSLLFSVSSFERDPHVGPNFPSPLHIVYLGHFFCFFVVDLFIPVSSRHILPVLGPSSYRPPFPSLFTSPSWLSSFSLPRLLPSRPVTQITNLSVTAGFSHKKKKLHIGHPVYHHRNSDSVLLINFFFLSRHFH